MRLTESKDIKDIIERNGKVEIDIYDNKALPQSHPLLVVTIVKPNGFKYIYSIHYSFDSEKHSEEFSYVLKYVDAGFFNLRGAADSEYVQELLKAYIEKHDGLNEISQYTIKDISKCFFFNLSMLNTGIESIGLNGIQLSSKDITVSFVDRL